MYRFRTDIISNNPDLKGQLRVLPAALSDLIKMMICEIPLLESGGRVNQEAASYVWFIYYLDDQQPVFVTVDKECVRMIKGSPIWDTPPGTMRVLVMLKTSFLDRSFALTPAINEAMSQLVFSNNPANDIQPMSRETRSRWRQAIANLLSNLWRSK